jgi:hypothetical protein
MNKILTWANHDEHYSFGHEVTPATHLSSCNAERDRDTTKINREECMDTKELKGISIRGALSMSPIKEIHFHDGHIERFNGAWDEQSTIAKAHYIRLAELLESIINSPGWKQIQRTFVSLKENGSI